MMTGDLPNCPSSYGISCNNTNYVKPIFDYWPVGASLLSCSLSVIGSLLTILPYFLWNDVRKSGIRRVVTYLAIADFFTASSYIMASINYLVYENTQYTGGNACYRFDQICQIQSYISSWSSYSSFWWTSILALFFYLTVVKGEIKKGERFFPLYHILSWGSPILVMFPLLMTGSLGYSLFAAGGWCFISDSRHVDSISFINYSLDPITIVKILVGGKAFELMTYVWVIVLYIITRYHIRKKQQSAVNYSNSITSISKDKTFKQMENKLLLIPLAFILLRMWGTLQFLLSIIIYHTRLVDTSGCVSQSILYTYKILAVLQSLGDGGQGWCNAILYIFLSPSIRHRLLLQLPCLATVKSPRSISSARSHVIYYHNATETHTPMDSESGAAYINTKS